MAQTSLFKDPRYRGDLSGYCVQDDRGDDLREKVDRKQEELAQLAEMSEADFLGPVGADRVAGQAPPHFDPSGRLNQGQEIRKQAGRDQDQRAPW